MNTNPTTNISDLLASDEIFYSACREKIFSWMEANGVARITMRFNGEGDSGQFDGYPEMALIDAGAPWDRYDALSTSMCTTCDESGTTIANLVSSIAHHVENTAHHGIDWWNNEGGQGHVEFILDGHDDAGVHYRRGISLTVEQRIVTYEGQTFTVLGAVPNDDGDDTAAAGSASE